VGAVVTRRPTLVLGAAALLAVAAAVAVVVAVGPASRPLGARVHDVAAGLRCPTCDAESVADSNTPIAQGMRREIRTQLRAGRSPDQVVEWFRARYGDQVVLMPGTDGLSWVLWAVPVAALALGTSLVLLMHRRRRAPTSPRPQPAAPLAPRQVAVAAVALGAVGAAVPVSVWAASAPEQPERSTAATASTATSTAPRGWESLARDLDDQGQYDAAIRAWRKAHARRPESAAVRTRLAFDLVRQDRAAEAEPLVRNTAREPGPYRSLALLVLGLAQRSQGDPAATRTLQTFLDIAPHHPAAPEVRRLLKEGS
jgi:cytochrome c-type biogenesis protein CcmH/NrfF